MMKQLSLLLLAALVGLHALPLRADEFDSGPNPVREDMRRYFKEEGWRPKPPAAKETGNAAAKALDIPPGLLKAMGELGLDADQIRKIWSISVLIRTQYVDDVDKQKLYYGALKGMCQALDPHSMFFTPEEYQKYLDALEGVEAGLGIPVKDKEKSKPVAVLGVFPESPAAMAGIKAGDQILEIDGQSTSDLDVLGVRRALRGQAGGQAKLKVKKTDGKVVDLILAVPTTPLPDVYAAPLAGNIGYVQLSRFSKNSAKRFLDAVEAQVTSGAKSLIVDVRDNGGGLLDQALLISSAFLKKGQVIVTAKGKAEGDMKAIAGEDGKYSNLPVALLVNGDSASASEVLAGALQDNKRATIVGERSWGKGTVQNLIPLPDGSALKLTVQRYYTPSGRSVDRSTGDGGIIPDVAVKLTDFERFMASLRLNAQLRGKPLKSADPVIDAAIKALGGTPATAAKTAPPPPPTPKTTTLIQPKAGTIVR